MTNSPLEQAIIAELRDLMAEEFSSLVDLYIDDSSKRLKALQVAVVDNHAQQVNELAHSFKGASSNVGANRLANLLQQVEQAGRNNEVSSIAALMPAIAAEFADVSQALRAYC